MVWGMASFFGSGELSPDGAFEGVSKSSGSDVWWDRLQSYYNEQAPEEQKRLFDFKGDPQQAAHFYKTFPIGKFTMEPGTKNKDGIDPPYGAVEFHERPSSWDTRKTFRKLGSLIKLHSKVLAVDEPLKNVIENFEPGLHEFFELSIRMPKGEVYPVRYYILRVGQYFDAFSRADSCQESVQPSDMHPDLLHLDGTKKGISGLAFRKAVFGSAHLWRDRQLGFEENLTCFSDELIAKVQQAGLRIPKHYKMREV